MINLLDIARSAQGGTGLQALSRQFGLDGDQTRRAVEGLLPAFSLALQRAAADPRTFSDLVTLMTSGRYAPFFDGAGMVSPFNWNPGHDVLGRLFGSDDVSRQVAAQVSAATGVGLSAVQHIMPALAGMIVGGLFKHATIDGYADSLRRWADALQAAAPSSAKRDAPTDPWSAWTAAMANMGSPAPPEPPPPGPLKPWTDMIGALMGSPPKPEPPPPPPPFNSFTALVQMFETGREVQAEHLANLQSIVNRAWGGSR